MFSHSALTNSRYLSLLACVAKETNQQHDKLRNNTTSNRNYKKIFFYNTDDNYDILVFLYLFVFPVYSVVFSVVIGE